MAGGSFFVGVLLVKFFVQQPLYTIGVICERGAKAHSLTGGSR